jgi:hypothetical protein
MKKIRRSADCKVDDVHTDFSKAFDRVLHGLLNFNLSILYGGSLLCCMGSYLIGQTQRVVRIDSMSLRGSASESLGIDILHFGY